VIVNGSPCLIAFEISAPVGKNFALDKSLSPTPSGEISALFSSYVGGGTSIGNRNLTRFHRSI
jgi:hypothetical protein